MFSQLCQVVLYIPTAFTVRTLFTWYMRLFHFKKIRACFPFTSKVCGMLRGTARVHGIVLVIAKACGIVMGHFKSSWRGWGHCKICGMLILHYQRIERSCLHHFAIVSSGLKQLHKFAVKHCNCVHGQNFSHCVSVSSFSQHLWHACGVHLKFLAKLGVIAKKIVDWLGVTEKIMAF